MWFLLGGRPEPFGDAAAHQRVAGRLTMHLAQDRLAAADPAGPGLAWSTMKGTAQPLVGLSHGAGGIGWALVRLGAVTDDDRFVTAGLAGFATLANGFGHNHSLCHGDLGNLELLLAAPSAHTDAVGASVLASVTRAGPRCGTPGEVETPGLMCGLAGVGYGLLRLHSPATVPSLNGEIGHRLGQAQAHLVAARALHQCGRQSEADAHDAAASALFAQMGADPKPHTAALLAEEASA